MGCKDPSLIAGRRAAVAYGVETGRKWVQGIDDDEHKEWIEEAGYYRVGKVFRKFVAPGQLLEPGESITHNFYPVYVGQNEVQFNIYTTKKDKAKYISDPGMVKVGTCTLKLPEPCRDPDQQSICCTMVFGQAELKVNAVDVASGKEVATTLKFNHV